MHLLADLVDPFPGRAARALEISIVCMLVVLLSMTYGIPDPATSAYVIFFAAKDDCGGSMIANVALVIVVTLVVAIAFALALVSLNSPETRILILAAWTFAMFYLATASKLAPLAGSIGLIIAYAIDLFGSAPLGEVATRGLLYAWLFVAAPMGVFLAYNMLFGRRPDILLGKELARRLRAVAAMLEKPVEPARREHVAENCRTAHDELLDLVKMTGLFHFQPPARVRRLRALVIMTYNLSTASLAAVDSEPDVPQVLAGQLEGLAVAVEAAGDAATASHAALAAPAMGALPGLWGRIEVLIAEIKNVAVNEVVPEFDATPPQRHGAGFFVPDAFQNPDHARYALKGTLAVMICYLTFTLLDWPAIHTCMLTCFIVGLTTVGESMQKLILRISGCLFGAAFGLLAIVYVMPHMESIGELMILIGIVTLPAAWIAVGKPSVAYIGFQAAFALYLCILQGDEPKFDLTIIRDRTIGIIFGNLVIYLIFTKVFPVSVLPRVRDKLLQLLVRSRELLGAIAKDPAPLGTGSRAAALQASLESVERSAIALGYENLNSPAGSRQRDVIDLCIASLQAVIDMVCRIAVCSSLDRNQLDADLGRLSLKVDAQLAALSAALASPERPGFEITDDERPSATTVMPPFRDGFAKLEENVARLTAALSDYRDLLRIEANTHA